MKKNQRINKILFLIITIFAGLLCSFFYQNINILKLNVSDRSIKDVSFDNVSYKCFKKENNQLVKICDNMEISFNNNSNYINYLFFNYEAKSNFDWSIKYNGNDYYNNDSDYSINGTNNSKIKIFAEKISNHVDNINISINSTEELKISNISINNKLEYDFGITSFISLTFVCFYLLFIFRNMFKNNIEFLFVIIATCFGLSIFILTPNISGNSWDDQIHFSSVYDLFHIHGVNYTEAANNSTSAVVMSAGEFNTSFEKNAYYKYQNNNNVNTEKIIDKKGLPIKYTDLVYLPSAIVFSLSNSVFHMPFIMSFALGRLINLILYIFIVFYAIKLTPKYKKSFTILGLIPTTLFLSTQYNRDSHITSFILLGLAAFINEYYSNDKIKLKNIIIFVFSILFASLAKGIYIPLILLLLILPKNKFNSKRSENVFKALLIVVFLLVMSTFVLPVATNNLVGDPRGGETSVTEQLKLVIGKPLSFVKVLNDSAIKSFSNKNIGYETLTDFSYAHRDLTLSNNYYYLFLIILIITIILDTDDKKAYSKWQLIFIVILNMMIWGMIWVALYLSFTPVGCNTINGVQGRYFIPLLVSMSLLVFKFKIKINDNEIIIRLLSILMPIIFFSIIFYNLI